MQTTKKAVLTILGNYSGEIFPVKKDQSPKSLLKEINKNGYSFKFLPRAEVGESVIVIVKNSKGREQPMSLTKKLANYLFPTEEKFSQIDYYGLAVLSEIIIDLEWTRNILSRLHTEGEIYSLFHKNYGVPEDFYDQYLILQVANLFNPNSTKEITSLQGILETIFEHLDKHAGVDMSLPSSLDELLDEETRYYFKTPNLDSFLGSVLEGPIRKVFLSTGIREYLSQEGVAYSVEINDLENKEFVSALQEVYGDAVIDYFDDQMVLEYSSRETWSSLMNNATTPLGWVLSTLNPASSAYLVEKAIQVYLRNTEKTFRQETLSLSL